MAATVLDDDHELVKQAKLLAMRDDRGFVVQALLEFEGSGTTPFGWLSFPPPQSNIDDIQRAIRYAEQCIELETTEMNAPGAQGTESPTSPQNKGHRALTSSRKREGPR